MRILLADNNDSFTRNLEHLLFAATAHRPLVRPYCALHGIAPEAFDLIVISPGPGHPSEYPAYARFIDSGVPVLGICMGMQVLNVHFGGTVTRLSEASGCVHGKQGAILMDGEAALRQVARYHSLHCSRMGEGLRVTAILCDPSVLHAEPGGAAGNPADGSPVPVPLNLPAAASCGDCGNVVCCGNGEENSVVMALKHVSRPLMGYQFHPESFLTADGTWYIDHALRFFRTCL